MLRFYLLLSVSFFLTGCYGPTQVRMDEDAQAKHRNEKAHISSKEKFMREMSKTERSLGKNKVQELQDPHIGSKYKW